MKATILFIDGGIGSFLMLRAALRKINIAGICCCDGRVPAEACLHQAAALLREEGCQQVLLALAQTKVSYHVLPCDEDCARKEIIGGDVQTVDVRELFSGTDKLEMLVAAPATEAAAVLTRKPSLLERIERIVFVGGAYEKGSCSPVASYHAAADPAALKKLVQTGRVHLMPLDCSYGVGISASDIPLAAERVREDLQTLLEYEHSFTNKALRSETVYLHDLMGLLYILREDLFIQENYPCSVQTNGHYTAGMTVIEKFGNLGFLQASPIVLVGQKDSQIVYQELLQLLRY